MSDTPRTDAECMSGGTRYTDMVHYTFAQQLEHELADALEQRDRLAEALQNVMDYRQGKPPYDFSQYRESERDNMAHDAWQVVEQNCLSLLSETSDRSDANAIND